MHPISIYVRWCFSVLLCVFAGTAGALVSDNDDVELSPDLPIVLSASRLRQSLSQAPTAVTVIDRSMINASGARTVPDLLRLVPGFQVGYLNGNSPTVSRGIGDGYARQMQVLIDGRSIYSPFYGGVEWAELPIFIEDIDRIEVVRGPNAASFGANSFLGVINVITREPASEHNNQMVVRMGEDGLLDGVIRKIGGSGELQYRMSIGSRGDYGFGSLRDNSRINLANFRGNYQLSPTDQLEGQMAVVIGERGQGYPGRPPNFNAPRQQDVNNLSLQLRWTRREAADNDSWVQFSYADRDLNEKINIGFAGTAYILLPGFPSTAVVDFSYRQRRFDLEAQQSAALGDRVRVTAGGQLRQDSVSSLSMLSASDWSSNNLMRIFGHMEWRPTTQWTFNIGAMYEKTSLTGGAFSPRAAANWEFVRGHTLRASWSRAERTPSLIEARWNQVFNAGPYLFAASIPSADLKSERATSREVGYLGDFSAVNLVVDFRLFQDRLADIIGAQSVTQVAPPPFVPTPYDSGFWTNQYRANLDGAELSLRWRPWEGGWIYYSTSTMSINSENVKAETGAPQHSTSVLAEQEIFEDVRASLGFYRVGSFKWVGGTGSKIQPAYDKLDLRLAKSFRMNGGKGQIALTTQNVWGGTFDFFTTNVPARTSYVTLDLPF